jgi:hypothetical protein
MVFRFHASFVGYAALSVGLLACGVPSLAAADPESKPAAETKKSVDKKDGLKKNVLRISVDTSRAPDMAEWAA